LGLGLCVIFFIFIIRFKRNFQSFKTLPTLLPKSSEMPATKIPSQFIQTVNDLTINSNLTILLDHNKTLHPNFDFNFYNNRMIKNIIKNAFPQRVYDAFMMINPVYGACISDFARYCLLYLYGGIYMDIKSQVIQPIDELLNWGNHDDILILSHWDTFPRPQFHRFGSKGELQNWVILCSPRHSVMKLIIDEMVSRIHSKQNGRGKDFVLWLTGPIMMTDVILREKKEYKDEILITDKLHKYFKYNSQLCNGNCRKQYYTKSRAYDNIRFTLVPVLFDKPTEW